MILVVFKLYVYQSKFRGTLNFSAFPHQQVKVKNLGKGAAFNSEQKHDMC